MTISTFAPESLLVSHEELGEAVSALPAGYSGACAVEMEGCTTRTYSFPCVAEAVSAANFAVGELGGYQHARVRPCLASEVTHQSWTDWAFG